MVTSIQNSLVPYRSGFDIIIPHGPEPVPVLQARDKDPAVAGADAYVRRRTYAYKPPGSGSGGVYSASGATASLAVETVGRIIDIHA